MSASHTTSQGEAWDQVAKERYGSEKDMAVLLPANPDEMDALLLSGETRLDVPDMPVRGTVSLPPWERM